MGNMEKVKLIDRCGDILVTTHSVACRNVYLTMAIRFGEPFDMMLAEDAEGARKNHTYFLEVAGIALDMLDEMTIPVAPSTLN